MPKVKRLAMNRRASNIELPDNDLQDDKENHMDASQARKKLKIDLSESSNLLSSASIFNTIKEKCSKPMDLDGEDGVEFHLVGELSDKRKKRAPLPSFTNMLTNTLKQIYNTLSDITVKKRSFTYSKEEKLFAVKKVVLFLVTWRTYLEESNEKKLSRERIMVITHDDFIYVPLYDEMMTVDHAIDVVSVLTGIRSRTIKQWFNDVYNDNYDYLADSTYEKKKKRRLVTIDSESECNIVLLGEVLAKVYDEKAKGKNRRRTVNMQFLKPIL